MSYFDQEAFFFLLLWITQDIKNIKFKVRTIGVLVAFCEFLEVASVYATKIEYIFHKYIQGINYTPR